MADDIKAGGIYVDLELRTARYDASIKQKEIEARAWAQRLDRAISGAPLGVSRTAADASERAMMRAREQSWKNIANALGVAAREQEKLNRMGFMQRMGMNRRGLLNDTPRVLNSLGMPFGGLIGTAAAAGGTLAFAMMKAKQTGESLGNTVLRLASAFTGLDTRLQRTEKEALAEAKFRSAGNKAEAAISGKDLGTAREGIGEIESLRESARKRLADLQNQRAGLGSMAGFRPEEIAAERDRLDGAIATAQREVDTHDKRLAGLRENLTPLVRQDERRRRASTRRLAFRMFGGILGPTSEEQQRNILAAREREDELQAAAQDRDADFRRMRGSRLRSSRIAANRRDNLRQRLVDAGMTPEEGGGILGMFMDGNFAGMASATKEILEREKVIKAQAQHFDPRDFSRDLQEKILNGDVPKKQLGELEKANGHLANIDRKMGAGGLA